MKAKLIKLELVEGYRLNDEKGNLIASTLDSAKIKISKQNCDEIFGVTDVERLADYHFSMVGNEGISSTQSFKIGFNKAMELNKDKVFTIEDMKKAMDWIMTQYFEFHEQPSTGRREHYLQLLKQPIAIEVDIVTEEFESYDEILNSVKKPILDSNRCLILKKI